LSRPARLTILYCLASAPLVAGCGQSEAPSVNATGAAAVSEQPLPSQRDKSEQTVVVKPIPVPEGTPEELFAFINDLDRELDVHPSDSPDDDTPDSSSGTRQAIALRRVMEARVAACDKILARQVPEETRLKAIMIQLDAIRTLLALDPEGMAERFDEYTRRIANGADPLLSRIARATRFQAEVNRSLSGGKGEPSADELIAQLQTLLDDPQAGPETLNASREAAGWLLQNGELATATRAFRSIGRRFANHPDATLADEGKSLISQSINLELTGLAKGVAEQRPEAIEQLLAKLQELLSSEGSGDQDILAYAMQTAQLLEFTGHVNEALQAYRLVAQRFQDDPDAALAAHVKRSVALAERRLGLVGKPLQIDGAQLSGNAFDWQGYRGQWVLVCFWAAWHQEWLTEVKNIVQSIAAYRDPAVSVVAISLDDDRNLLERFLKEHPAPWPIVINPDPTAAGFENPNAVRCGVEAVPFIVLVNPQGIVVDVHLMGDRLAAALATHVGSN
jgi:hypothetical protein